MMYQNLTQPELGILYIEMQVPLHFHKYLNQNRLSENEALNLHQVISDQKPDTALISLGLCGIALANHILSKHGARRELAVLGTELKYFCIDVVERYGRIWINAREYDMNDKEAEKTLLIECPELLNALGSIVQEIHEYTDHVDRVGTELGRLIEYQAYAHANLAESYIDMLKKQGQIEEDYSGDPIPVPMELQ